MCATADNVRSEKCHWSEDICDWVSQWTWHLWQQHCALITCRWVVIECWSSRYVCVDSCLVLRWEVFGYYSLIDSSTVTAWILPLTEMLTMSLQSLNACWPSLVIICQRRLLIISLHYRQLHINLIVINSLCWHMITKLGQQAFSVCAYYVWHDAYSQQLVISNDYSVETWSIFFKLRLHVWRCRTWIRVQGSGLESTMKVVVYCILWVCIPS